MQRRMRPRQAILAAIIGATASGCGDGVTHPATRRTPTLVIVSGDKQSGEVGTVLPEPLVVRLTDSLGVAAAGIIVRFGPAAGTVEDSSVTDVSGIASARWTLGSSATKQLIRAVATLRDAAPYANYVTFSVSARAGPPAKIVGVSEDGAVAAPETVLDTLALLVGDRFGNPAAAAPVTWAVQSGGGSVRPLSTTTDLTGVARALWTIGPARGENALTATVGAASRTFSATGSGEFVGAMVAVGGTHSCALTLAGAAYCWGENASGQLGVGRSDTVAHRVPLKVTGGVIFRGLVAGLGHTCGLTTTGEVYCWGNNRSGQLGSVFLGQFASPTRVEGIPAMTALAAGDYHTCGLTNDGIAYCWGDNAVGQLGDGRISSTPLELGAAPRPTPEPVAASQAFVAIAAGHYSSCAISREGATYCWGGDAARELGMTLSGGCPVELYGWDYYSVGMVSDYPCSTVPVRVNLGRGLTSLSAGGDGQCGVTADAALVCWGFLFDAPFVVPGARVSRAWVTESSVCGLEMSGVVTCWSLDGTFSITLPFGGDVMLVNLDSNGAHTCGVSQATPGAVYCEGSNDKGQLGDGTTYHRGLAVGVISPREP